MSNKIDPFVQHFRASAPYIHAHRGRTFVLAVSGEVVDSSAFRPLLFDVALLHALGVRIVLVAGVRPQIDKALQRRGLEPQYQGDLRITDAETLEAVKEAAGSVRVEIEALLSMGLPNSPMSGAQVQVSTGNFVVARPIGVLDGVDFQFSGRTRRVEADAIRRRLDDDTIVVLTPIGYSSTGEVFNISSYEVAAEAAIALGADKLIGLVDGGLDDVGSQLSPADAERLAAGSSDLDLKRHVEAAVRACGGGVPRAHLVSGREDGALLRELFTVDGVGTLITAHPFEGMRQARRDDVAGMLQLIEPLEDLGILVRRSRQMLEKDIERFTVIERDGMIIACAALYGYPKDGTGELACLVVHPEYRASGRGDELLNFVEQTCRDEGLTRLFVLTTQTQHWFQERGFVKCDLDDLPQGRRRHYDGARRSKILIKQLKT